MRKDPGWIESDLIPMNGFRASAVDLGWLKEKALTIVEEKGKEYGAHGLEHLICLFLRQCIQRLKNEFVFADPERNTLEVRLVAKDDDGYYEYKFAVAIPVELWIAPNTSTQK
jgi:hypothetical protein